ncbi:unnamed protein product [Lactuca saligna]|uniref:NPH3 domain-containing protein n=1 Tax=Lactuca saligna TaxID=75948 RepID=A0AA35Y7V0_LACSI|nr:unnamed protein product [Lactuca saligna]
MAPGKALEFYQEANDWFCNAGLPSDIMIIIDKVNFHLHKFPLSSRCGKIDKLIKETQNTDIITLEDIPEYLEMFDEYGDDNLLARADTYFHKNVVKNWKDCMVALQSCDTFTTQADNLQIISKCLNAVSMMACTDPSLFGWPMMMYGRLQSPGGSILWNGINTGARIRSSESDWWFEDVSYLSVPLFVRLMKMMEARGIPPEKLTGAIMYYCRKYLHGLGRWKSGQQQTAKARSIASLSMKPAIVDQRVLLESIVKLLPEKKGKSFCRFLLGLLRVALILGVNDKCQDSLEKKIGMQLELATLDALLIPTYSNSDTLYNSDCVERIINHFLNSEKTATPFSPPSIASEVTPSSLPLKKVSKLVDNYMAEVASDVNLKPEKIRSLAEALPESSRSLNDGLYRALDLYFKAHPWLHEKEKEDLCNIINYQKLSIDACAHASQNDRLPLRVHLQNQNQPPLMASQIVQRDGWVTIVRENQVMKVSMERLRSRVGELEQEFNRMKEEVKRNFWEM